MHVLVLYGHKDRYTRTGHLKFSPMHMSEGTWECGFLSTTCTGEPPEDWHQTGGRHVSVPFQPTGTLSVLTWGPQVQLRAMYSSELAHLEGAGWFSPRFFLGLANGFGAYLINLCVCVLFSESEWHLVLGCWLYAERCLVLCVLCLLHDSLSNCLFCCWSLSESDCCLVSVWLLSDCCVIQVC